MAIFFGNRKLNEHLGFVLLLHIPGRSRSRCPESGLRSFPFMPLSVYYDLLKQKLVILISVRGAKG
jgi:hypothetical protein